LQTLDHDALEACVNWLELGEQPWLCTIVATVGPSPRPLGSMLAALKDGRQVGTVSGGCVEEELLERMRQGDFDSGVPELCEYGVSAESNERLGLPCGGRLKLLLQQLTQADTPWLKQILQATHARQGIQRVVSLSEGTTQLRDIPHFETLQLNNEYLRQSFGPRSRLLLVGAAQLAQKLAELALAMDYDVVITDPRQQALDQWPGPDVELIQGMPDDVIRARSPDQHTAVITLTHDPRIDDMALMEALESNAWYVGALGSPRTTEQRLARLAELGISAQNISRLHAPVGLPIGSKTPIEIAVAIMAQLTQLKRSAS
jgi:xanthine dehydrogenase accessory factor